MSIPAPPPRNANDVLAKQLMDCAVLVKKGEQGPLLHKTLRDLSKYIGGAPSSVDGSNTGSQGSRSAASEGNTKGARNKFSQFGKKIVGTLKHSSAADEDPAKPPPVVGRVIHGSADKATWIGGHEHEGDWCEEHFCQGCACKQRKTSLPAQPVVSTNVTRVRVKPAFHRPTNPQSAMVANGWIEQARRSKMRTVWKEVLASVVEGRKPGEETTLWIQREVITDGKTTLEALHQLPIRWMQDVTFIGDIENRFSIKIYHLPDEFTFRCPDEDAAQNWVLTLRSMKEISQRQTSAPPTNGVHDRRIHEHERKVVETQRPPVDNHQRPAAAVPQQSPPSPSSSTSPQHQATSSSQEDPPRMSVKELRAIAHGVGVSTIGMERKELEAIVFKITSGQPVIEENTKSTATTDNHKAPETSPDHDESDRGRSPIPIERSPSDEEVMADKQREEDSIEKEKARQRQFEKEEALKRRALREEAEKRKVQEEEARLQAEKEEEARQKEQQERLQRSIAEKVKRQQELERKRKEEDERKALEAERLKREEEDHKRRVAELHAAEMRKKQEEAARLQQEQYKQQQEAWKHQQQVEAERLRAAQQHQAEEARRQHEAFLRQQQAHQQQQYPQWQQPHPGQHPQTGHPQWQHPPAGQHHQWQQQNGYPPNQQFPRSAQMPQQGQDHPGHAPSPQSSSPFSSKYANMAKQNEAGSIEKIKHGVLVEWALQPPQFQILRPIEELLMSIHGVFPPRFGVPSHDYFSKWSPIKRDDLGTGPSMGNRTDNEKLNKIVRKQLRFFLHPDKLPKDLSEGQVFVCKLLWDICNDAWEEHKKREEELGWMRS